MKVIDKWEHSLEIIVLLIIFMIVNKVNENQFFIS